MCMCPPGSHLLLNLSPYLLASSHSSSSSSYPLLKKLLRLMSKAAGPGAPGRSLKGWQWPSSAQQEPAMSLLAPRSGAACLAGSWRCNIPWTQRQFFPDAGCGCSGCSAPCCLDIFTSTSPNHLIPSLVDGQG